MKSAWSPENQERLGRLVGELFAASDAIARRFRINVEDFREGLHDAAVTVLERQYQLVPARDDFVEYALNNGRQFARKGASHERLDDRPESDEPIDSGPSVVEKCELAEMLAAARRWLEPLGPMPAHLRLAAMASMDSTSLREAARALGIALICYQRLLGDLGEWLCCHDPCFREI